MSLPIKAGLVPTILYVFMDQPLARAIIIGRLPIFKKVKGIDNVIDISKCRFLLKKCAGDGPRLWLFPLEYSRRLGTVISF